MSRPTRYLPLCLFALAVACAQTPNVRHASEFSGDAAQRIQSCIDALPAGGGTCVVDLQGTTTISRGGILVGSASKAVLLQFPKGTNLEVSATDDKDVFSLFDNSGMVCENTGAIMVKGASCRIHLVPGARVRTLITNGQKDGTQESLYLRGLLLQGDPKAAVSAAAVEFTGVFVPTVVEDTTIYDFDAPLLELAASASPPVGNSVVEFRNVWLNGAHRLYARPLVVQGTATTGNGQIMFFGGAIEHQGMGMAAADIDGAGGTQTSSVAFLGTYFENSTFLSQLTKMSRQHGELTLRTAAPHGLNAGTLSISPATLTCRCTRSLPRLQRPAASPLPSPARTCGRQPPRDRSSSAALLVCAFATPTT